jgi:hypothetical protein
MTENVWTNQKKINGRLCQVDWRLISALQEVVAALRSTGASDASLAQLEALIVEADDISASVAIPDPPGCSPVDRASAGGTN